MTTTATASPFNEGGQFAWDATSLSWFMDCPWKYKASMIEGWQSRLNSVHLVWGAWVAKGVERFHRLLAEGNDREDAIREVVRQALIDSWDHEADKPIEFLNTPKTRENLIRTLVWYFEEFNPDPVKTVILHDGTPAVEFSFQLPIDNGYVWCGHWDRLGDYNGDLYIQDQKSTGSTIGPYWFANFDLDVQFSGYAFAGHSIFKLPIRGVMIDGIQVAVGFSAFQRGFTTRSQATLDEWYEDTLYWIERARQAYQDNYFPRNRMSCTKYGGCTFKNICNKSPEVRKNFLRADFVKREARWNPLEAR